MIQRYNGVLWMGSIYAGSRHLVKIGGGTTFSHADWLGSERILTTTPASSVKPSPVFLRRW